MSQPPPPPPNSKDLVFSGKIPENIKSLSDEELKEQIKELKKTKHLMTVTTKLQLLQKMGMDEQEDEGEEDDMFGRRSFYRFDKDRSRWIQYQLVPSDDETPKTNKFTLLTWNVWFDRFEFKKRSDAQLELICKEKPDFICIQEATKRMIKYFGENEMIREMYMLGDSVEQPINFSQKAGIDDEDEEEDEGEEDQGNTQLPLNYGVFLLVRRSLVESKVILDYKKLPFDHQSLSVMFPKRYCLHFDFCIGGSQKMSIASVHLESTNSAKDGSILRRWKQLKYISMKVQGKRNEAICCGDFNFCPYNDPLQNTKILVEDEDWKKYDDVWPVLNLEKRGYTRDSVVNKMVGKSQNDEEVEYRKRIDRVMIKSEIFKPTVITIVGTQNIGEDEEKPIYPSDHFGLLCTFERI